MFNRVIRKLRLWALRRIMPGPLSHSVRTLEDGRLEIGVRSPAAGVFLGGAMSNETTARIAGSIRRHLDQHNDR